MTRIGSVLWPADFAQHAGVDLHGDDGEQRRRQRRQHVGAQAGGARHLLALETDHGAEGDGEQQAGGDDALRKGRVVGIEHPPLPR